MFEIMRCVFEKREPVRDVTALALMQYVCEEFPRSRVDVVGTYVGAVMNGIDLDDDSIAVSCYLTLPDEMPYLLEYMLASECLRVLRIVNRANTLSRRYGWRTRWLPLASVEPLPYLEWRAYFVDPTKPDFAFEHMQAHNV